MSPAREARSLAPITPSSEQGLATIPKGMEQAFTPEEWRAMNEAERSSAMEFFRAELKATTEGLRLKFSRWKFPAAGGTLFLQDMGQGQPAKEAKELHGIVVAKFPVRAFWDPTKPVGSGGPPLCSSNDGVKPLERPTKQAATCAECKQNQFGTGKEGVGKACKSGLNVFFLEPGEEIPSYITLPVKSIEPFSMYATALRKSGFPITAVHTVFSLADARNAANVAHKVISLHAGSGKMTYNEMKLAARLRDAFEQGMRNLGMEVPVESVEDEEPGPASPGQAEVIGKDGVRVNVGENKEAGF